LRLEPKIASAKASCRRPIKDSKILVNSGFPWVLGFLSYRSSLSYLRYLCLAPWIPSLLVAWLPGSLAVAGCLLAPSLHGSLAAWVYGSMAPRRHGPRDAGNGPAGPFGSQDEAPSLIS